MAQLLDNTALANALLKLVRAQHFELTPDSLEGGQPIQAFPSLDLAVAVFPHGAAPIWANVLFSRDFPNGHVAHIADQAGAVNNVRYLKDQLNAALDSMAWLPGADWARFNWQALYGNAGPTFVEPYPASLLKVMVLVGVARLVDTGKINWDNEHRFEGITKTIAAWADSMIVASNNDATTALVAVLHLGQLIVRQSDTETNHLHALFAEYGLPTLRLANTKPDGGWRSAQGAGVGNIHMTAWDTVRLLWLLSDDYASAPWLPAGTAPMLSEASRQRVWRFMGEQGLHAVLSSTTIAGVAGWQSGIPAQLSSRWLQPDGSVLVEDIRFPADVRAANDAAEVHFAHKTGNTENYCSDAGLVQAYSKHGRRYIIALLSNLGSRYQADPDCDTTWRIPALGHAIDQLIADHFE